MDKFIDSPMSFWVVYDEFNMINFGNALYEMVDPRPFKLATFPRTFVTYSLISHVSEEKNRTGKAAKIALYVIL